MTNSTLSLNPNVFGDTYTYVSSARLNQWHAEQAERRHQAAQAAPIPAKRFGTPAEFGSVCAFLCSQQAAYLTGQNILLDGGAYPGTF